MTREEAIAELKRDIELENDFTEDYLNAVNMAFKALEQEPILDKIRAEIKQEYQIECEHPYGQGLKRAIEIIDKYRAESEVKE